MNCLKVTSICVRTYARRAGNLPGLNRKVRLLKTTEGPNVNIDSIDHEDIAQFESDFLDVGTSYDQFEKDTVHSKEFLKRKIVESKYFKQYEPPFLTFLERDQIKKLHESSPEEWTVERLSESFPALPSTIRKVLKSQFVPDSVEKVLKYDEKVSENWKKFNSGKLLVDDVLNQHLQKFKGRKISLTDRHLIAEKIVPTKTPLPTPTSKVFSNIVRNYVAAPANQSTLLEPENTQEQLTAPRTGESSLATLQHGRGRKQDRDNRQYTFDEFAKAKLPEITRTCPEEGSALLNAYRKQLEATEDLIISSESVMNFKNEKIDNDIVQDPEAEAAMDWREFAKRKLPKIYNSGYTEKAIGLLDIHKKLQRQAAKEKVRQQREEQAEADVTEKSEEAKEDVASERQKDARFARIEGTSLLSVETEEVASPQHAELPLESTVEATTNVVAASATENTEIAPILEQVEERAVQQAQQGPQNSLSTFIKERINRLDMLCNYAKSIKIPRNVYKPGMTYKVEDCYYDHDGEFLYRVPGLK